MICFFVFLSAFSYSRRTIVRLRRENANSASASACQAASAGAVRLKMFPMAFAFTGAGGWMKFQRLMRFSPRGEHCLDFLVAHLFGYAPCEREMLLDKGGFGNRRLAPVGFQQPLQVDRADHRPSDLLFFGFGKRRISANNDATVRDPFANLARNVVDHRFFCDRDGDVGIVDAHDMRRVDGGGVPTFVNAAAKSARQVFKLVFVPLRIYDDAPPVLLKRDELIRPIPDVEQRKRFIRRQVDDGFLYGVVRF